VNHNDNDDGDDDSDGNHGGDGKKKKKEGKEGKEGRDKKEKSKGKDKDKGKDDGKKKKKEEKEKEGRKKKAEQHGVDDLLLMDFGDSPVIHHSSTTASAGAGAGLLGMHHDFASTASAGAGGKEKKEKKDKDGKEKKSKKSSSSYSHVWLPLVSDRHADVFYSIAMTGPTVAVTLRAVNTANDGASISVNAQIVGNFSLRFHNPQSAYLKVATHLTAGDDAQTSTEMHCDVAMLTVPIQTTCNVQILSEQLVNTETTQLQGAIKIPICAAFTPHKVDEQGFALLVGKSSSKSASAVAKVPISSSTKPKSAFKAIAGFLRAHTVEAESSKAASLATKTPGGHTVCILAKVSKDGAAVSVDVKCLCGNKTESQSLADGIVSALADLSL
jgi:hypothetical protein